MGCHGARLISSSSAAGGRSNDRRRRFARVCRDQLRLGPGRPRIRRERQRESLVSPAGPAGEEPCDWCPGLASRRIRPSSVRADPPDTTRTGGLMLTRKSGRPPGKTSFGEAADRDRRTRLFGLIQWRTWRDGPRLRPWSSWLIPLALWAGRRATRRPPSRALTPTRTRLGNAREADREVERNSPGTPIPGTASRHWNLALRPAPTARGVLRLSSRRSVPPRLALTGCAAPRGQAVPGAGSSKSAGPPVGSTYRSMQINLCLSGRQLLRQGGVPGGGGGGGGPDP